MTFKQIKLKSYFFSLAIILFVIIAISRTQYLKPGNKQNLKAAIELSEGNKDELKQVLDHYKHEPQKLEAAKFLIRNMPGLTSIGPLSGKALDNFHNVMDSVFFTYNENLSHSSFLKETNRILSKESNDFQIHLPEKLENIQFDIQNITSDFLIKNIDMAFNAWQTNPKFQYCSFDHFCENILPYRLLYPAWQQSRNIFMEKYNSLPDSVINCSDPNKIGDYIEKEFKSWYNGGWGDCFHKYLIQTIALRSIGVPTTFQSIPHWGNYNRTHSFYTISFDLNGTSNGVMDNSNIPKDINDIVPGTYFDEELGDLLNKMDPRFHITFNKTIPKIFRHEYAIQDSSLLALTNGIEEIPAFFRDDRLIDVSNEYLETANIDIDVPKEIKSKIAYLCVFNKNGWVPVHWSIVKRRKASFDKMGKNIVYLPAIIQKDQVIPFGYPFLLKINGKIEEFCPTEQTQDVNLYRKFCLTTYAVKNASECIGIRFQGANKIDLSDTINLHKIENLYLTTTEIPIKSTKQFRYLIFQFSGVINKVSGLERVSMAEIKFFTEKEGKDMELSGNISGNKGLKKNDVTTLFDKDELSFYKNDPNIKQHYVVIDLGENNAQKISKIRFCPRNDDNFIVKENSYELFYWDKEWISLGIKVGDETGYLHYDEVPKGALFWLQNHTKGKEERIFTIDNGKQVWW